MLCNISEGKGFLLTAHIVTMYASCLIFSVASVAAILYLIQDSLIKNKRIGTLVSRLPSLSSLDKLNYRSIGLGFPILSLSIICGFIWQHNMQSATWWNYNLRQIYSLVIWLVYAAVLHERLSAKLRGRKIALLSLFAFFVIILSLFGACH